MPTTTVHAPSGIQNSQTNPLPQLLRLPSGLAILELQGDINFPDPEESGDELDLTTVGNLVFPDATWESTDLKDLKRVWLYVGQNQRLTGEVKALPKPLGILRKRRVPGQDDVAGAAGGKDSAEELEIVDIVRHRIIFSKRPEPVGTTTTA